MRRASETVRKNMIEGQLRPNHVSDPAVIAAIQETPRERFVPGAMQRMAYVDEDISLGNGRYLPEPAVLALLIQAAGLGKEDIVLDIGCGTGYSCAILGRLAGTVVGIEQDKEMAQEADRVLHDLDICNAVVVAKKDLHTGYAEQGPYNVILINGSVSVVPEALMQQLAQGGRLVAVVSEKGHMGAGVIIKRQGEGFVRQDLFNAAVPALSGFEKEKGFVF